MRQADGRCGQCHRLTVKSMPCPATRAATPWFVDLDGCKTRTVEGGVCASAAESYARDAARQRVYEKFKRRKRQRAHAMGYA